MDNQDPFNSLPSVLFENNNNIANSNTEDMNTPVADPKQANEIIENQLDSIYTDGFSSSMFIPSTFLSDNGHIELSTQSRTPYTASHDKTVTEPCVVPDDPTADHQINATSASDEENGQPQSSSGSVAYYTESLSSEESQEEEIDENGDTPLHKAIIDGVTFVDMGEIPAQYINHQNYLRQTPLNLAVLTNNPENVKLLLKCNADPNILDSKLRSPVHIACSKENVPCLKALLDSQHKRPNQMLRTHDSEGQNCLHIVVNNKNAELAKVLLDRGADINAADRKSGRTALHFAVETGNTEMIRFLLQYLENNGGLQLDARTYAGETPLKLAHGRGNTDVVAILEPLYPASERRNPYDDSDDDDSGDETN
ncbi:NF-kappa-B inhibitor alpha-like [Dreissena polymorpha]|uniref:NF-kappa-B inhibitor cactus n=1 Tax=Dreissena polymorpha TaxID=45954 RepID=A0A9D4EIG1_DREPO|nr:NF-kappa-B inhibitor alpha-like [Dreissena polymorpha]XP_052227757.1 NF-kappa-B inhibitor alpha-like [Dreissena polymorpha]XP_052227758.1 NF-kappa-B inhibitor alpha-like [Dreissena polymorpha]XP_052227759.1 NF-kappa-B inhibitor alpha-like [Dreissena polymorpha]XP_052227760.1 NF-kappa-B inhibitor alpha-like [Dreissena polymorpha]XP_052227762.1 NF-kappa-B inhibitor alpha-like [Dreissena polymorpha]XP_052227763.1 NF-kappa-B inhibitor alpha-like [Dreissena polymorpha]XP_052227764.1 NF-kappa-B